jgi:hypothetical protein
MRHMREMHARKVRAHEMHACKVHAHEMIYVEFSILGFWAKLCIPRRTDT